MSPFSTSISSPHAKGKERCWLCKRKNPTPSLKPYPTYPMIFVWSNLAVVGQKQEKEEEEEEDK